MCGIVGIVNLDPREPVDETLLKRMRDVLRHRGPDGEGLWVEGPVGLGHRRLAIVDVAGGQQPMPNEDASCWITYNGEIYNHADLRPGLEARGHRYHTRSDTETILHLYEEEQERCVERLRGMFAFALWDRTRKRLLLARDRLGIKHPAGAPLCVGDQGHPGGREHPSGAQRNHPPGVPGHALRRRRGDFLPGSAEAPPGQDAHVVGQRGIPHAPLLAADGRGG